MESIAQFRDDRRHRSLHVSRAAVREAERVGQLDPVNLASVPSSSQEESLSLPKA